MSMPEKPTAWDLTYPFPLSGSPHYVRDAVSRLLVAAIVLAFATRPSALKMALSKRARCVHLAVCDRVLISVIKRPLAFTAIGLALLKNVWARPLINSSYGIMQN